MKYITYTKLFLLVSPVARNRGICFIPQTLFIEYVYVWFLERVAASYNKILQKRDDYITNYSLFV